MELGFKELTADNYLQPDEMMRPFVVRTPTGTTCPIAELEWASEILAVGLGDHVATEVHQLFAVARGAMLYGCFFYPLFTLASEHLLRAAEAAITLKCRALSAPTTIMTFDQRITWLCETGILTKEDEELWHSLRKLRNTSSHPSFQMIFMPGQAVAFLGRIAAEIDQLYAREPGTRG